MKPYTDLPTELAYTKLCLKMAQEEVRGWKAECHRLLISADTLKAQRDTSVAIAMKHIEVDLDRNRSFRVVTGATP